jgi:hypothetical protein
MYAWTNTQHWVAATAVLSESIAVCGLGSLRETSLGSNSSCRGNRHGEARRWPFNGGLRGAANRECSGVIGEPAQELKKTRRCLRCSCSPPLNTEDRQMPHPTVSALFTKAVLAKACAAVMVTGAAGVAYETIPDSDPDTRIETVSVSYAENGSGVLAFDDAGEPEVEASDDSAKPESENKETAAPKAEEPKDDAGEDGKEAEKDDGKQDPAPPVIDVDKIAPRIEILHPADGSHYESKVVVFEGKTEPGAKVHAGRFPASVDAEGNWRIELILSPGANGAVITATDAAGNVGEDKVTVWLDVPKEEKPPEPKDETGEAVAFKANQKYGSCDAEVPYEKFWGTATPNSFVNVTSAYGSGVTEVNKQGEWEILVYFPDAPRDQHFVIKVTAANGSQSFEYVAKAPYVEPIEKEQPVEPKDEV